jgi:flagellin-like protein
LNVKKLSRMKKARKAISPVVATLILIIIAIVGAVAVGLIMSSISTNTSKQSNVGNVQTGAQDTLYVGGSTTVYPVEAPAVQTFEQQTHYTVYLSQGGSDAGMQGILGGTLDVGASSSVNAVNKLFTAVTSNNILTVSPVATIIGGSGVVFGTTSKCATATAFSLGTLYACSTVGGSGSANLAGPLYDGTNACLEVTRDALTQMYADGTFYIVPSACAGTAVGAGAESQKNTLDGACVLSTWPVDLHHTYLRVSSFHRN